MTTKNGAAAKHRISLDGNTRISRHFSFKTLAKIANHAKRVPAFRGSLALLDEDRCQKALARIDVGDIWGIGRQYQKFLKQNGIENALQLREADDKFIDHYMTMVGHKTILELRGYSCIGIMMHPRAKSIVTSKSFGRQVSEIAELAKPVHLRYPQRRDAR